MAQKMKIRHGILVGTTPGAFFLFILRLVKFLNLRFNVGGCYDIKTACFVCDVNGLYFFGTALASYNDSRNFEFYMNVTLFCNGYG